MQLSWHVCDHNGRVIGDLQNRSDAGVRVAINDQRTGSVTGNFDDRPPRWVRPGHARMKVFCHPEGEDNPDSFILHNGLIVQPRSLGRTIEIPTVDQSVRLLNASHAAYPTEGVPSEWDAENLERSEAMWQLINRANKRYRELSEDETFLRHFGRDALQDLGIKKGDLADSRDLRDWKFAEGQTTWDALVSMAEGDHSPDFELEPLDRDDGVHCQFNTYSPRLGRNKVDDVILEFGYNVDPDSFSYEPSATDVCNRYALVGRSISIEGVTVPPPVFVAENWHSMYRYGIWQKDATAETSDMERLKDIAKEFVAVNSWKVAFVDLTPNVEVGGVTHAYSRNALGELVAREADEFAVPPQFGPPGMGFDYWIGDTITIRASEQLDIEFPRLEGAGPDYPARVIAAEYKEIDEAGNVAVSLTCAPHIKRAFVRGYESQIQIDPV